MLPAQMDKEFHYSTRNVPRAHYLVMKTAREFAGELHEVYSGKWPDFHKAYPSQNAFVRKYWPAFIEEARATLARLLGENIDEKLKKEIYDALIRDQSLAPTRKGALQVRMDI